MTDTGYLYEYFLRNSPGSEPQPQEEQQEEEA